MGSEQVWVVKDFGSAGMEASQMWDKDSFVAKQVTASSLGVSDQVWSHDRSVLKHFMAVRE